MGDEQHTGEEEQQEVTVDDHDDVSDLPNIRYWNNKGSCGEGTIHHVQDKTQVPWPVLLRVLRGWKKNPTNGWYFKALAEWPQDDHFDIWGNGNDGPRVPRHYRNGIPGKIAAPLPIEGPSLLEQAIAGEEGTVRKLFEEMDVNGNGMLSLAEIDKAVVERYPDFNAKPAMMRAMKLADSMGDKNGLLTWKEFDEFVAFLGLYIDLWHKFESASNDGDRRMDLAEFTRFVAEEGLEVADPAAAFAEADRNGGGQLLFDEFCYWVANKKNIANLGTSGGLVGYTDSTGRQVGEYR